MPDEQGQGISRRDLLKKGAALGGAVVWATPVVQTLGMGRAYASTASPPPDGGKDISYIGINVVDCEGEVNDFFVKWEAEGGWENNPGAAPECEDKDSLPAGMNGGSLGFDIQPGPNDSCKWLLIPDNYSGCTIDVWVKAGSSQSTPIPCNKYLGVSPGPLLVCSAPIT